MSLANSNSNITGEVIKKSINNEDGEEEDFVETVEYEPYKPSKVKFGVPHPDPVVENATLAAVEPPDIFYNLALPASVIAEGKLSNLQLEALLYGCQRHQIDLPQNPVALPPEQDTENIAPNKRKVNTITPDKTPARGFKRKSPGSSSNNPSLQPYRGGFLLGDGAGMGKGKLLPVRFRVLRWCEDSLTNDLKKIGRTLAAFVLENIMRGRKKHIWVSVSNDLYHDGTYCCIGPHHSILLDGSCLF